MTSTAPRLSVLLTSLLLAACTESVSQEAAAPTQDDPAPASVPATATDAVAHGALVNTALWHSPDANRTLLLGAAEIAGLLLYEPSGAHAGAVSGIEASLVATLPDPDGSSGSLVLVADAASSTLGAYTLDPEAPALRPRLSPAIEVDDEITGLCTHVSALSGAAYAYVVTDRGLLLHYELYLGDGNGDVNARLLRTVPVGKGNGFCAVDPRDGMLYLSEEHSGVWRLGAEPETDTALAPVDLLAPFGGLSDDIKGVAVYPVSAALSYLLVADVGQQHLAVYALPDTTRLGTAVVDGLAEPEGVTATRVTPDGGMVVVADEGDGSNLKLVKWTDLAGALGLETAGGDPVAPRTAVVRPTAESEPLASRGDAADDPVIWVHPDDVAGSRVIGTDKQSGLHVYDLEGRVVQYLEDGKMNNVDLRDGFSLGGREVTLVAASNRTNDSIAVYRLDPDSGTLSDVADGVLDTGFADPYGLCMYRSAASGDVYVFVNDGGSGVHRQWRLTDHDGRVAAEQVREFTVGSQAEGCVADDETGDLYVAEEDVGIWKYSAEPDGGSERRRIDATGDDGRLTDDVEGLDLWLGGDGTGYLVASNQGANNYAVYRREGDNAFVGLFHIVANAAEGIDGASETDGLAVSSAALGEAYPDGLLVVQDGRNIAPEEGQNFKYVSWRAVMEALASANGE